jgi:hypothetical protein
MSVSERRRRPVAALAGAVSVAVLVVVLVGAVTMGRRGDGGAPSDPVAEDTVVPFSWVASAGAGAHEVTVFAAPDAASASRAFPHPTVAGDPLVFLVDGNDVGADWLPVFLPVRSDGSRGWVRRADVTLSPNVYRIEVALGAHRLQVRRGNEVVIDTRIAVGPDAPPTPGGACFLEELIRPPDPHGAYGPYGYGLSGFSEGPAPTDVDGGDGGDFDGGDGTIGIHGTDDPSSIGTDVSDGGIRVPNDVITEMADLLPLGTPVDIRA